MAKHQGGSGGGGLGNAEPSAHLGSAFSSTVCQADGRFFLCSFFAVLLTFFPVFSSHRANASASAILFISSAHHFCIFLLARYQLHRSGSPHSTNKCQPSTTLPSSLAYNSTS